MNTLIIYDTSGYIISQMQGDIREPIGIPHMKIEVPQGRRVISVDTMVTPHVPIYEDIPKSQTEDLKETLQDIVNMLVVMSMS